MAASLDVVGLLAGPGRGGTAADLLASSVFGWGVGTSVSVAEVHRLHVAAVLVGGHRAAVTSIKWCPAYHSCRLSEASQLRLASGDADGCVVVWDVAAATVAARFDAGGARVHSSESSGSLFHPQPGTPGAAAGAGGGGSGTTSGAAGGSGATGAGSGVGFGSGGGASSSGGGVQSMAWVMPGHTVLAVVVAPALLLLWDVNTGSVLWRRELSSSEVYGHLAVDPLDSRHLCLCGSSGAVAVLQLHNPAADKVALQQYRVNVQQAEGSTTPKLSHGQPPPGGGGTLQALFAVTRGLLVLLLPRELLLFDLELGTPVSSTALAASLPAFSSLLGVFGSGVCQGAGDEGGTDFLYGTHTDGALSVWVRVPGELRFKLGCLSRLAPPPLRASGSQLHLSAVKAALWWKEQPAAGGGSASASAQTAASTALITAQLSSSLGLAAGPGGSDAGGSGGGRKQGNEARKAAGAAPASASSSSSSSTATPLSGCTLLVMALSSDARVWQWEVPLPRHPRRSYLADSSLQPVAAMSATMQAAHAAAVPATVSPQLVGLLHNLPGPLTTIALQPCPLLLPSSLTGALQASSTAHRVLSPEPGQQQSSQQPAAGAAASSSPGGTGGISSSSGAAVAAYDCVAVGAGATATGHLTVFTVRRGLINPLATEVLSSLAVHRDAVRGLRWLGPLLLLVSFSSERISSSGAGGWRNAVMLTDVRTGRSAPFRDSVSGESSPLVGIRVSPSGAHLLLLFKGAPAELWTPLPPPEQQQQQQQQPPVAGAAATAPAGLGSGGGGGTAPAPSAAAAGIGAGLVQPWRIRLVDLPFSAVEWVVTEEGMHKDEFSYWGPAAAAAAATPPPPDAAARAAAAASMGGASSTAGSSAGGSACEPWRVDSSQALLAQKSQGRTPSFLAAPSMTAPAAAAAAGVDDAHSPFPSELLAFSLADGRSGVLSFRGRKVHDVNPKRPSSGVGPHSLGPVSAVAAVWPLMLLGDAEGCLMAWDLLHGRCTSLATGLGMVRRIVLAPAAPPVLSGAKEAALSGGQTTRGSGVERMRIAVVFASGQLNVYELDAIGRLRAGGVVSAAAASRLGAARDIAWLPLPTPAGLGSILSAVVEDGSLALLDASQPLSVRPAAPDRQRLLREVLSTPSFPAVPVQGCALRAAGNAAAGADEEDGGGSMSLPLLLLPPAPLGSSVLLQQPWVLLLRLLLQAGISQDTLLYISSSSSSTDEDDEVRHELQQLLPRSAQAVLAHLAAGDQQLMRLQQDPAAVTVGDGSTPTAAGAAPGSGDASFSRAATTGDLAAAVAAASGSRPATSPLLHGQTGSLPSLSSRLRLQQLEAAPGHTLWTTPEQRFRGDLLQLLRQIAKLRGSRQLLLPDEWHAYTQALKSGQVALRMSVAARLSGHADEARFWTALPATLASVKAMQAALQQRQQLITGSSHLAPPAPAATTGSSLSAAAAANSGMSPPHVPAPTEAPAPDAAPAAAAAAAAAEPPDYDSFVRQALESSAAASGNPGPAVASPLGRRGSGGAVPGRVLFSGGSDAAQFSGQCAIKQVAAGRTVRLWDEELVLSDAQERLLWSEALPGQVFDGQGGDEGRQRRLLAYCSLGDFATAVAFLLSTPPEGSVGYYRSMVCALALAATASLRAQGSGASTQAAATLHLQAAKVVSAHAASIGDTLLGVPLSCSAGLNADAVTLLQEAGAQGLWHLAASLTARALTGTERAQALSRWAAHVQLQEGSTWRAVGLLTSAGCCAAAVQVLRAAGLPDCAEAYVQACGEAGLLLVQTEQHQPAREGSAGGGEEDDSVFAHKQPVATVLFDLLANRSGSSSSSSSEGGLLRQAVAAEFHAFAANLVGDLAMASPSLGGQA